MLSGLAHGMPSARGGSSVEIAGVKVSLCADQGDPNAPAPGSAHDCSQCPLRLVGDVAASAIVPQAPVVYATARPELVATVVQGETRGGTGWARAPPAA